jgi:hypothetical protein
MKAKVYAQATLRNLYADREDDGMQLKHLLHPQKIEIKAKVNKKGVSNILKDGFTSANGMVNQKVGSTDNHDISNIVTE